MSVSKRSSFKPKLASEIKPKKSASLSFSKPKLKTSISKPIISKTKAKCVVVPQKFEIVNGLSGMLRDIILQLCNHCWSNTDGIRMIFGMCNDYYQWRCNPVFLKGRFASYIKVASKFIIHFPKNGHKDFRISCTPASTLHCTFSGTYYEPYKNHDTLYLDNCLKKEVHRWEIQIKYDEKKGSTFWLGASWCCTETPKRSVPFAEAREWSLKRSLGDGSDGSQWAFSFGRWADGTLAAVELDGYDLAATRRRMGLKKWRAKGKGKGKGEVEEKEKKSTGRSKKTGEGEGGGEEPLPKPQTQVPDNARVSIEADVSKRSLSLFVNGVKVPHVLLIRDKIFLGVAGRRAPSFTSLSFRRLSAATSSRVAVCTYESLWPWGEESGDEAEEVEEDEWGGGRRECWEEEDDWEKRDPEKLKGLPVMDW